jgi:DNA-binding protein HU-beta
MNRNELVDAVAQRSGESKSTVDSILTAFDATLVEAVSKKEEVKITGLFTLDTAERSARQGRNPQTGESIDIAAATVARLRPGARLKNAASGK